ncbi:MAG: GNAT family N-acetyltransferase [Bacteroidota bacterium]|nr:GNAT family N-acetyltransferase [Bacteroidota bacterium]MDP4204909.1 GNAT family N-acetyltransferase [Bacteroidota bacterium]
MKLEFRNYLESSDLDPIYYILDSADVFIDFEIDIALKLAEQTLELGDEDSGTFWVIAEDGKQDVGFACYGADPFASGSYYLRWMGVKREHWLKGIGKLMLKIVENDVTKRGGKHVWIETSSRIKLRGARTFFEKRGYSHESTLHSFYDDDDDKMFYVKHLKKQ